MAVTQRSGLSAGDIVEVSARRVGYSPPAPARSSRSSEAGGHPHYLVRWEDGHTSIFYPGEGTTFRRLSPPQRSRAQKSGKGVTEALVGILRDHDVEFEVLRTDRRRARLARRGRSVCSPRRWRRRWLPTGSQQERRVRAVVPASSRLDLGRLAEVVGATVRLLSESELAHAYPEFELGAVPPFGGPEGDRVVVDRSLGKTDHVRRGGGSARHVVASADAGPARSDQRRAGGDRSRLTSRPMTGDEPSPMSLIESSPTT